MQKTLASTLFLFFACISPAIAFGALFDKGTDGQLGAFEMILSSALSGIFYAFFAGQPLCIMGATGPELAYTLVFYEMCKSLDIEFMAARFWCGMWCALMTIILALTDSNASMGYVTQFTEDVFSALISLIFIIDGLINIFAEFSEDYVTLAAGMFSVILAFCSFGLAMYCRSFPNTKWMLPSIRKVFSNFGVTISVILFTVITLLAQEGWDGSGCDPGVDPWCDVKLNVSTLNMPETFEPTMVDPEDPSKRRDWIINPMGRDNDLPTWAIFFTILPAIGLCILGFLDQNLTSLLINRKKFGVKKPAAYHQDLLTCGVFIYPICSIFGLPFTHAATIRSLTHLKSLTNYDQKELADGTKVAVPVSVVEQRVTQLGIHTLIALSSLASSILGELPVSVLYGVFLYMGVSTISGNDLFDRMSLWFIWDTQKYPAYPFLKKGDADMDFMTVHKFTFVQFVCLVILYALKSISAVAVVFPFFLLFIAVFRHFFVPCMFEADDLRVLDPLGGEIVVEQPPQKAETEQADNIESGDKLADDHDAVLL